MLALRYNIFGIDEGDQNKVKTIGIPRSGEKFSSFAVRFLVSKKFDKLNEKGDPTDKRQYLWLRFLDNGFSRECIARQFDRVAWRKDINFGKCNEETKSV